MIRTRLLARVVARITSLLLFGYVSAAAAQTVLLTNGTLKEFIDKNKDVVVAADTFEAPEALKLRLDKLARPFEVTYKLRHGGPSQSYTYDHARQSLLVDLKPLNWIRHASTFDFSPQGTRESMDLALTSYPAFAVVEKEYPPVVRQGTTGMGVKLQYREYRKDSWGIVALNIPSRTGSILATVEVNVSAERAKQLVDRLVWRIQGSTVPGVWSTPRASRSRVWGLNDGVVQAATLDSPSSFYLVGQFAPAIVKSVELVDMKEGKTYGIWNPDVDNVPR